MASVFVNIPILNEVDNVEPLIHRLEHQLESHDYIILLIDDGSTDGTIQKVEQLMDANPRIRLIHRKKTWAGCQRGGALFDGMSWGLAHTSSLFFIEMDGDLSHRPEEIGMGLALLEGGAAEMVIASKYLLNGKTISRPFGRRAVSAVCNLAVRTLLTWRITDYSNGFRFYTRSTAEILARYAFKYTSPIYLSEVMAILLQNEVRISEFPTTYVGRNEGISKLRLIDLVKAALAIFEIAGRYHFFGFSRAKQSPTAKDPKPAERAL
jgi:dolichol-phosphate mannosyltransferase